MEIRVRVGDTILTPKTDIPVKDEPAGCLSLEDSVRVRLPNGKEQTYTKWRTVKPGTAVLERAAGKEEGLTIEILITEILPTIHIIAGDEPD